jgi:phage baseplate assembly protein W
VSNLSNGASQPLGTCWAGVSDLAMPSVMASGNRVVAEAVVDRWTTPRGGLIDDQNYGYDLTDLISKTLTPADLAAAQTNARLEAMKDPRVASASVAITSMATGVISVVATLVAANGPFQLVLAVSSVTVTILQVSPT